MIKLCLVIVTVFISACSVSQTQAVLTPEKTVSNIALTDFFPSVDESVGCPATFPIVQDIKIEYSDVMSVTTNARALPGLYMNAIASKALEFKDDSIYTATGEWRVPEDGQNQQIDINLQRVENAVESHAEILWDHGETDLNGWIWTRFQDLYTPVKLFYVGIDHNWHRFKIVVRYESIPRKRIFESIAVDNHSVTLNKEMGTLDKAWDSSFFLMLETTNKYTNCSSDYTFVGKSQWRNISVERLSIP